MKFQNVKYCCIVPLWLEANAPAKIVLQTDDDSFQIS